MYKESFFERVELGRPGSATSKFASRLRILRKKKGYSQEAVSEKLGLAKITYGTYENCRYIPDAEKIAKMADFYNVSADYLLGLTDNPLPNENFVSVDYSRKCVDVLLDIAKTSNKKRAFEYIVKNKRFKELLVYIDTYLLFSRKLSRSASPIVKDAYDEISKIDLSANKHLPTESYPEGGIRISDIYLGLITETLRDLLINVSREDICAHLDGMRKIIKEEVPENVGTIFGVGELPNLYTTEE